MVRIDTRCGERTVYTGGSERDAVREHQHRRDGDDAEHEAADAIVFDDVTVSAITV
jgi:hypothetical protein